MNNRKISRRDCSERCARWYCSQSISVDFQTPVVETQTVRRQAVLENKTITELPAARGYGAILAAIPTLQGAGANSS
jgi:hypothetical protein